MIPYLRARHRLAVDGALLAIFVFGCFAFGVLSVRRTTEGVLLTAALFCVVVYWVKPEGMVGSRCSVRSRHCQKAYTWGKSLAR